MKISVPELCLVVLVGATGSVKSSFAGEHFLPTEVVSSDFCRGLSRTMRTIRQLPETPSTS